MRTKKSAKTEKSEKPLFMPEEKEAPMVEDAGKRVTIGFNVDENGKIDLGRMRQTTKDQIKELLLNKDLPSKVGIIQPSGEVAEIITQDDVGKLLDGVSVLSSLVATRVTGCSGEIANKAFTYDEHHRSKICPPAARILSKLAPDWAVIWKDEIGLAVVMGSVVKAQIDYFNFLLAQERRDKAVITIVPQASPEHEPGLEAEEVTAGAAQN